MHVAVVVPRYGPDIAGGAERLARGFAEASAARGWGTEVWTTCARSHYSWENVIAPGAYALNGVTVRRFPVTRGDTARHAALQRRLASVGTLAVDEQYAWLESGAHSAALYAHVAAHARQFDAVVVVPYALPLSHYAAWAAPEHVVVWPCLHDEPHAYTEPVRLLLESVRGVVLNSPEEAYLAVRILGARIAHHALLGVGVEHVFAERPTGDGRYLLYIGRLEAGKNVPLLYDLVRRYAEQGGDLRLVVAGAGPVQPPAHPSIDFRGYVDEEEKAALCAGALALCQPSLNESFSITAMESWLAGRPVLVHADCAVTRGHVQRSKGGLWFRTYPEFAACVDWLRTHAGEAARMGENGRAYVARNYAWDAILDRFEQTVSSWRVAHGVHRPARHG